MTIQPGSVGYIPMNVVLDIPENAWVLMAPRSSAHKLGITAANGIGIGDADFCGENDEYHFAALNFTSQPVTIERGSRIAQALLVNLNKVEFEEVHSMQADDRGSFGSTGLR